MSLIRGIYDEGGGSDSEMGHKSPGGNFNTSPINYIFFLKNMHHFPMI